MNSVISTHFAVPGETRAFGLEVALDRLGAYLEDELDALSRVLSLAGQTDALSDIAALAGLHLGARTTPGDVRALLQEARTRLERLLDSVRRIPVGCEVTAPAPEDFDAGVCWAGARLEDIVATLSHILAA
jgi:hypothetical protein